MAQDSPFRNQEYWVRATFVTTRPKYALHPAAGRSRSSPPRLNFPVRVIVKNLPNRAKPDRVKAHVEQLGFPRFHLHLPVDPRTGVNRGYAFVLLPDRTSAVRFCALVHSTQLERNASEKRLEAAFASHQAQGKGKAGKRKSPGDLYEGIAWP